MSSGDMMVRRRRKLIKILEDKQTYGLVYTKTDKKYAFAEENRHCDEGITERSDISKDRNADTYVIKKYDRGWNQ